MDTLAVDCCISSVRVAWKNALVRIRSCSAKQKGGTKFLIPPYFNVY